jgi:hypothetical protein
MRILRTMIPLVALLGAVALPTAAETFTETFDAGSNVGGWSYFPQEQIESTGGNPGAYLHTWGLDTYAPWPTTTENGTVFTGDYRSINVTAIGVDLLTIAVDFSAEGRECTLTLRYDNGTPGDFGDDWVAFKLGPFIPEPGDGWFTFDFAVPSQSDTWPDGWDSFALGPDAPDRDWVALMSDVAEVGFHHGDPLLFYIFQQWELGLDNPRITFEQGVATESASWGAVKALFE